MEISINNVDDIDSSKCFMWNTPFIDPIHLTKFVKTNKILCIYDNKENSLDKYFITSSKFSLSLLTNLSMFVSNKSSFKSPPIIILNNISFTPLHI